MNTDQIVDSKVKTMTDLSGKKSKILLLKNETEIEAFKEQLRLYSVSNQRKLLSAFKLYYAEEYGEMLVSGVEDEFLKHIST